MKTQKDLPVWEHQTGNSTPTTPCQYLFNQENLMNYESGSIQALSSVHRAVNRASQVYSGKTPQQLATQINQVNFSMPSPSLDDALTEIDQLYLQNAVYFHHPSYVAHLNCPVAYPAVIAEQILTAINSSVDTFDQSGGATLMEQKLVNWTCEQVGYDSNSDGIFTSGGSQSNLMALLIARDWYARQHQQHDNRELGLHPLSHQYRILTSEISHFSVQKSAALLGLGHQAVISVPVDQQFRMDKQALEHTIQQCRSRGELPIAIVATGGTTDFGSIDPLHHIAELCEREQIWFHVDAAYGCGLLNSQQHRTKLSGIERASSVTVDYHKSFLQPVSCSAFLLKDQSHFALVTHHADYLNPKPTDPAASPNLVDKSLQTTRRFDGLKLWLTLRTMGQQAIGEVFDQVIDLAQQTWEMLSQDDEFEVIHQPEISTVVFRFYQAKLDLKTLNQINNRIKDQLFEQGKCAIARTKFKGVQYLKFTLLNPDTNLSHIREIVSQIKTTAYLNISASQPQETSHE